jgi:glycosyltransferase involved in cell wall biosynthesis
MSVALVLTIAIPTWNRCDFLKLTLRQLHRELESVDQSLIEILISDNASEDRTAAVVAEAQASGLPVRAIRNADNIGSDANIAQCFNLARGDYVLILGDDDLLVDGCLAWLMSHLEARRHGVVSIRAYGFENDFRAEFPGEGGETTTFTDPSAFLVAANSRMTLISSNVLHKAIAPDLDANRYCGGNLVQVHLVLDIALRAQSNLFVNAYKIACKRNNSGGYDFSRVFVEEFGRIIDSYRSQGLSAHAIRAIDTKMMLGYLPFYLLRERLASSATPDQQLVRLKTRFGDRLLFWLWLYPIVALPRRLAIGWGSAVTFVGRASGGDLRRGWCYVRDRMRSALHAGKADAAEKIETK